MHTFSIYIEKKNNGKQEKGGDIAAECKMERATLNMNPKNRSVKIKWKKAKKN